MTYNDPAGIKSPGLTAAEVPINQFPTITLSETEFARAKEIARARNQSYNSINGGRVCGDQTSLNAHLTGVVGEMAYAIATNSAIDDSIYRHGDGGHDFEAGTHTIDTKTTSTDLDRPSLIVPADPEPVADLYVLLQRIDTRTARLIGATTRATVIDQPPVRKPGDTLNHIVPQRKLWLPPIFADDVEQGINPPAHPNQA